MFCTIIVLDYCISRIMFFYYVHITTRCYTLHSVWSVSSHSDTCTAKCMVCVCVCLTIIFIIIISFFLSLPPPSLPPSLPFLVLLSKTHWGLWVSECVCIIMPTLLFVYMFFEAELIPP